MTIRGVLSMIFYDYRYDPAFFRVIFKHSNNEFWDVPLNFLRFEGQYFYYDQSDIPYPLYRIVAIYDSEGKQYLHRSFDPDSVTIKPMNIDITPGIRIDKQFGLFHIARYSWLIIRTIESIVRNEPEYFGVLGSFEVFDGISVISDGYFSGTILYRDKIYRGCLPIQLGKIRDYLHHQRIYVYHAKSEERIIIGHYIGNKKIVYDTNERKISVTKEDQYKTESYSEIKAENKIVGLINQKTKRIVHPKVAGNICKKMEKHCDKILDTFTSNWVYIKNHIAIIADFDSIPIIT